MKTVPEIGVSTDKLTLSIREPEAMFSLSNMKSAWKAGTILPLQLGVDHQLSRPFGAPSEIQLVH